MDVIKELKYLEYQLTRRRNYLKSKVIMYWDEYGYQETTYNEMDYHFRINNKRYNDLIRKMDNIAFRMKKLQNS